MKPNTFKGLARMSARAWARSSRRGDQGGLTLIELMVTIAVLAVMIAIAVPGLRQFGVRSQLSGLTNDFARDIARTRIEAISRNTCVKMCMSANTNNALIGTTPTCDGSGTDWQPGWVIFTVPSCNAAANTNSTTDGTLEVIAVQQRAYPILTLIQPSGTGNPRYFFFDAKGQPGMAAVRTLTAQHDGGTGNITERVLCVSAGGRVSTLAGSSTCN
jgi:type IV fimbrial biogenesis protein FimT